MKRILFLFVLSVPTLMFSQITFSPEIIIIDNATGYERPRIALTASNSPFIIWSKVTNPKAIKSKKWNGYNFGSVLDLVSADLMPTGFIGPEIVAKGDTVYLIFESELHANHVIYMKKSFDGGLTFSDTIRVSDNSNTHKFAMPNIDVREDGNPIISYMESTTAWTDWKQMVKSSTDFGQTFSTAFDVSAFAPGEPCDCCQSTMVTEGNDDVFLLFRNDDNNVRNMYISKSIDGGISFTSTEDLDDINWVINACPTSSAYGVINGDSILVVRRNGGSGVHQLYFSNVNKNTLQKAYFKELDPIGSGLQDKVAVAGDDNIVGVVWEDNRSGNKSCYFSYSTTGVNNLGNTIEMSDSTAVGHKIHADINYSNGKFFFVYEYSGNSIIYKELDLSNINNINLPTIPSNSKVISTTDFQGKRCKPQKNMPYLNIYQDGRVEKRVVIE